jgi:REP element-mobilizing transposase RayT
MVRSISDVPLFRDDNDKDKYLLFIQKYQKKLGFKVYAYCLMTTHGHLIIDANGADISKVMHGINQCYAQYFNFRHKRHGHVFQDRFKSKVVDSEEYLFTLSAYISELDEIGLGLIDGDGCYKNIKWHNA